MTREHKCIAIKCSRTDEILLAEGLRWRVGGWAPVEAERVYRIVDNLSAHRAADVLWFSLAHPRCECVSQPKYLVASHLRFLLGTRLPGPGRQV